MQNYKVAKVSAYLLDMAITQRPSDFLLIFRKPHELTNGSPLGNFCQWTERDLVFFNKLLWDDSYHLTHNLNGYFGIGIERDEIDEFRLVISASKGYCNIFNQIIDFVKQQRNAMNSVTCDEIKTIEFASSKSSGYVCNGGTCILTPGSGEEGVLGGWFDIANTNPTLTLGITNNHVATEFNKFGKNTSISVKGGQKIGEVYHFVPLHPMNQSSKIQPENKVDVAFIRPVGVKISHYLGCTQTCPVNDIDLEQNFRQNNINIKLCGKGGNLQDGEIKKVSSLNYITAPTGKYKFIDAIEINKGDLTDSGSLIVDKNLCIGGIFFALKINAQKQKFGIVAKWTNVKLESGYSFNYSSP